ncbi:hypothetical protein [Flavobacterium sp.]|uniref:hypothetical protein n=1 Tax=Flavobacterium sp. TaxID=239 RepID=UPI0025BAF3A7|nr:hypothetical protein [Flavobacterium sp.]
MKPRIISSLLCGILFTTGLFAQDRTTVTATNYDVSDNLDLKAVASIFGDSRDLEDFERRLNDPDLQISNLDLNGDNEVDYLRVIESTEGNTRLVVVQAVLDRDVYQDVATIEVERSGNDIQVQVVGDTFMYGPNYIYEPVYVTRPAFFSIWWGVGYHPYASNWYWGYYPSYWHVWRPMPVYRYRNHVHVHVNVYNQYNYVNVRRSRTAAALYSSRRENGYAQRYQGRSFEQRNKNVSNRYELDRSRGTLARNEGTRGARNAGTTRGANTGSRETTKSGTRSKEYPTRSNPRTGTTRDNVKSTGTRNGSTRATSPRTNATRSDATKTGTRDYPTRNNPTTRSDANRSTGAQRSATPNREMNSQRNTPSRVESPRPATQQRAERQSAPQVQRQSTPQVQRQSAPQMQRQSAPQMQRQSQPQMQRQSAPQMQRQSAPQAPRQSAPQGGGQRGGGDGGGRR